MQNAWDQRYAHRIQHMRSSAIRELLKVTAQPDTISFAGGLPAPDVFPIEQIAAATQKVLQTHGAQALQYSPSEGYRPLLEWIARRMSQDGVEVSADNVFITSGSQQGLDFVGRILIDPGDRVLVESPTYMGALQAWGPYEASYIAATSDEHGLVTEHLEEALRARPKFIYVLPNFQNPTGISFTMTRRQQLVEMARDYDVPIIEDDPYAQLRFEGEPLPSLIALDARKYASDDHRYRGNVIHLNTFSKILSPGLRLGWIIAPPEVIRKFVQAKQGADLHTATFNQMIAYEVVREGFLDTHIPVIRRTYRERRDVMLNALAENFPEGVHWTYPEGGMFLWITLPQQLDSTEVLREALKHGVAFVPGTSFHAQGGGTNTMRLSFSNATPEKIQEGIARLSRAVYKLW